MAIPEHPRVLLVSNSTQHGTGYLEHCADTVREFFAESRRIAFVPYALADHDAYAETARTAFDAFGCSLTSVHEGDPAEVVEQADGVFIGGGNTFRLLQQLYATGLVEVIRRRVRHEGVPYMGTSAGSNVATLSIRTTNDMPIVYPPTFDALALVPIQLNPHYLDPDPGSTHMGETRETRIREFHEENPEPVLGLREGGILRFSGGRLELLGPRDLRVFRAGQEAEEVSPGTDLTFLLTAP